MNDRRMTERIMHSKFLLLVVSGGVDYKAYPVAKKVEGMLIKDISDTLDPVLDERRREKLMIRSTKAVKIATAEYVLGENASPAKLGLIIYYLLRALVDVGYLTFERVTDLTLALDIILPSLEDHTVEKQLDKSAQKQARHLFNALQREGFYQGMEWPE